MNRYTIKANDHQAPKAWLQAIPIARANNRRWFLVALAALLSIGLLAGQSIPAQAQSQQRAATSQGISSGQAANIARRSVGGKVLSVRPAGKHYRVKLLKRNGVVTQVRVNRGNGRVSR